MKELAQLGVPGMLIGGLMMYYLKQDIIMAAVFTGSGIVLLAITVILFQLNKNKPKPATEPQLHSQDAKVGRIVGVYIFLASIGFALTLIYLT